MASVRKVVVYEFMSLDGVAENIAGLFTEWDDDEVDAAGAAVIATQDAVILGRRSYDEWAPFWPGSEIEPFATFINTVPKYVATSTPLDHRVGERECDRRWAGRLRARPEEPTRRRHRRPRQHLGRADTAGRRRRRRTQARDRAGDRRRRAKASRRVAADPPQPDPKRDLADGLPDSRLPRHRVGVARNQPLPYRTHEKGDHDDRDVRQPAGDRPGAREGVLHGDRIHHQPGSSPITTRPASSSRRTTATSCS